MRAPLYRRLFAPLVLCLALGTSDRVFAAESRNPEVGVAVCDITPELPIRLAGYAGRKRPADKIEHPLLVQALALKNPDGERFVIVALDNCGVSRGFMRPVLQELAAKHQLARGAVAVVSSHTHSAPVLAGTLSEMTQPSPEERSRIEDYSRFLQSKIVEVVSAALADCRPAIFEQGKGRATFAMNRRVYSGDQVVFGDNPDGPVDWDVPVLRIKDAKGSVRAVLFGYACHGTSVRGGDYWYAVSGEYMAYARQHIENHEPGAIAVFLTGMGADIDPSPRGQLLDARRHGLELAGAVMGVLNSPMREVRGSFRFAYDDLELPLVDPPSREELEKDAQNSNVHVKRRAETYLGSLNAGSDLPRTVTLPVAALRFGNDLTFVFMGGEVVVDYQRRLKRMYAADGIWPVGYAYEVPCYIPSARLIKEGGYETEDSMMFYGYYGPFKTSVENQVLNRIQTLLANLRSSN
jgi:neutral ceramidase